MPHAVLSDHYRRVRQRELTHLEAAFTRATARILDRRQVSPMLGESDDGWYFDGSYRTGIDTQGGSSGSNRRVWPLVVYQDRTLYLVEDATTYGVPFREPLDSGTFGLALSDPTGRRYHNEGVYIGTVTWDDLREVFVSIDLLIMATTALDHLYTEQYFRELMG